MHRMSFVAGAAVAFIVSAAGWSVLQSAPVSPVVADQTFGMAMMSAVVDGTGALAFGSGSESASRLSLGSYSVKFNRPIRGCTFNATSGNIQSGQASASYAFPLVSFDSDPNGIAIQTYNPGNGLQKDAAFHLMVFCHK